jgi:hypothetical protein
MQQTFRLRMGASVVGALILIIGLIWLITQLQAHSVEAASGPRYVHCHSVSISGPQPYLTSVLNCITEDGVSFADGGMTAPPGQRFYVTDLVAGYPTATYFAQYRGQVKIAELEIASDKALQAHFVSPYFVLPPGDRLYVSGPVFVSGYISSEQSFLPNVAR